MPYETITLVHVLKRNLKMVTDRDLKKIRKLVKEERNRRELTKCDTSIPPPRHK